MFLRLSCSLLVFRCVGPAKCFFCRIQHRILDRFGTLCKLGKLLTRSPLLFLEFPVCTFQGTIQLSIFSGGLFQISFGVFGHLFRNVGKFVLHQFVLLQLGLQIAHQFFGAALSCVGHIFGFLITLLQVIANPQFLFGLSQLLAGFFQVLTLLCFLKVLGGLLQSIRQFLQSIFSLFEGIRARFVIGTLSGFVRRLFGFVERLLDLRCSGVSIPCQITFFFIQDVCRVCFVHQHLDRFGCRFFRRLLFLV